MTQPSRTTESISRDNAAIRDIMLQIRELTVPDRATLALGLIGHLATMMNRSQMSKLMDELQEEAERVQDVPPIRQRDDERTKYAAAEPSERTEARAASGGSSRPDAMEDGRARDARSAGGSTGEHRGVGQGGRGEFTARKLL
jgi:hypothetical protein